jgi:hypothetical protein
MQFVRVVDGTIVDGPSDLSANWVGPALVPSEDGDRHVAVAPGDDRVTYVALRDWPADQLALLGWVPLVDEPPPYVPERQALAKRTVAVIGGGPRQLYDVLGPTEDQVNAIRDQRLAAGFADPITGKTFQADADSIGRLGAVGAAAGLELVSNTTPAPSFQIIAADNAVVTLPPGGAFALLNGRMMPWVSATMLYARQLKDQIVAGQAPDITAGWP